MADFLLDLLRYESEREPERNIHGLLMIPAGRWSGELAAMDAAAAHRWIEVSFVTFLI
jgi:hypothetical protein